LEALPESFADLLSLRILFLVQNKLTNLPEDIGKLRSLNILSLRGNKIERLPDSITDLSNLGTLTLDQNNIVELPVGFGRLQTLTNLDLRANHLRRLPKEIADLPVLRTLRADKNQLTEIPAEIAHLKGLQVLSLEENQIDDLPKQLGELRSLDRAAMSVTRSANSRGLFLNGNPLIDPYPILIAHGQPSATTNVLAWLRGELDSSILQNRRSDIDHDEGVDEVTPPAPAHELGPNLQLVVGRFDLATDNDVQGNYDRIIQNVLHVRLNKQLELLKDEAQRFSNQHPLLARTIVEYAELASQPLDSIDVVSLWTIGNALIAQSVSFEQQDISRTISDPLEPHQQALLIEASRLHGGFIFGFPLGAELTQRADRLLSTPYKLASIGAPTSHVLGALSKQRHFLSERARKFVQLLEAALFAAGWKSTRAGYSSYVTVRNFLIEMGKLVVLADAKGSTISGSLVIGAAVSVSGMNAETFAALVEFFRLNSSELLSFAAPFPELRVWVEWIINHLDDENA
jgi:Leucine-rich repeat (LRR) protein